MVKCLPAMRETWVRSLGREDPLEKEMETHSSTLTWKILWTEELGSYSPWGCKESDMTKHTPCEYTAFKLVFNQLKYRDNVFNFYVLRVIPLYRMLYSSALSECFLDNKHTP